MINRLVSNALAEWLAANEPAELSGVRWLVEDESDVKTWPAVIIEVTGSQEHEIKIGNYDLSVQVALETNPEDTTKAAAATMKDALSGILGDLDRIKSGLDNRADLLCYDVRVTSPLTTIENDRRRDVFGLTVVAAAQV